MGLDEDEFDITVFISFNYLLTDGGGGGV